MQSKNLPATLQLSDPILMNEILQARIKDIEARAGAIKVIEKKMMQAEFGMPFFRVWSALVRWVIPVAIGVILVLGVWEKLQAAGA